MADAKKKKAPAGDLAVNRRAWHDYAVLDKIECGIVLSGTEVKVVRHGEASLSGAYGAVLGGELYIVQMNIPVYAFGNRFNTVPSKTASCSCTGRKWRRCVSRRRRRVSRSCRCASTSRAGA